MSKTPAALARAVARRNPKAIAIVFFDENGRHQTVWQARGNPLELSGGASLLAHEINWMAGQDAKSKPLPRRRPRK